jgi:uncharacterized protein YutE (UPF0331/DUF86 family)
MSSGGCRLAGSRSGSVVLKREAVRERLLRLEEVITRLEELRRLESRHLRENFRDAWAVERGLQIAAEIVFDVGNHILSAHFGKSAQDYEDIIAQLAGAGVIARPTGDRLKGLGGFRNILVHGYLRLDPDRVIGYLGAAPALFSEFARDVRKWLASLPSSPGTAA